MDADCAGSWSHSNTDNPDNVMSCTGYIISYAGCPVGYYIKFQAEIALNTAEAEYIALYQALGTVITLMTLVEELNDTVGPKL